MLHQSKLIKKTRVSALVLSVGNITTGGTGKTSVTRYLAQRFHEKGKKVVIISHGVSGMRSGLTVSDGKDILAGADKAGDEAYLLARALPGIPVLSGRRRERLAGVACKDFGAEVVILDDAFHALRLARDHDILVFNCLNPLGNGRLLPTGPLREPLFNLRRADIFWLNHVDLVHKKELEKIRERLLKYNRQAQVVQSYYRYRWFQSLSGKRLPKEIISGKKVWVCAGIGEPDSFIKKVEGCGAEIKGKTIFPDHHFYGLSEIEGIPMEKVDFLVITEKDSVRFPKTEFADRVIYPFFELDVEGFDLC